MTVATLNHRPRQKKRGERIKPKKKKKKKGFKRKQQKGAGGSKKKSVGCLLACLLNVPAAYECISGCLLNVPASYECISGCLLNVPAAYECISGCLLNVPASYECISGCLLNVPAAYECISGCLLNVPAAYECISGTDLLRHLQIKLFISPSHGIQTPGQPIPALTLYRQAPIRVATGLSIFKSLVRLDQEKSRRKRDSNPASSALEADALTTQPTRRLKKKREKKRKTDREKRNSLRSQGSPLAAHQKQRAAIQPVKGRKQRKWSRGEEGQ